MLKCRMLASSTGEASAGRSTGRSSSRRGHIFGCSIGRDSVILEVLELLEAGDARSGFTTASSVGACGGSESRHITSLPGEVAVSKGGVPSPLSFVEAKMVLAVYIVERELVDGTNSPLPGLVVRSAKFTLRVTTRVSGLTGSQVPKLAGVGVPGRVRGRRHLELDDQPGDAEDGRAGEVGGHILPSDLEYDGESSGL